MQPSLSIRIPKYDAVLSTIIIFCTIYLATDYTRIPVTIIQLALIINAIFFLNSEAKSAKAIICALFIAPEPALFSFFWVYLARKILLRQALPSTGVTHFIAFIFALALALFIYNFITERLIINYVLWLSTFFSAFAIFLYGQDIKSKIPLSDILKFLGHCLLIQFLAVFIQALANGNLNPGDWAAGTLGDAHKLGLLLLLALIYFFLRTLQTASVTSLILLIASTFFMFTTDSKAILLSAVISLPIYMLVLSAYRQNTGKFFLLPNPIVVTGIILAIYTLLLLIVGIKSKLTEFEIYIIDELVNSKYIFFNRVWIDIWHDSPLNWLLGTGPGTLGSRASNILSGDLLYKSYSAFLSSTSEWSYAYMRGLWTEELATNIGNYSAILSYPFSGLSSIKAELGILGLALYIITTLKVSSGLAKQVNFKRSSTTDTFSFTLSIGLHIYCFCLLFDNYQEQPGVSYLLFFLCGLFAKSPPHQTTKPHHQTIKHRI